MLRNKLILAGIAAMLILSSCGIFHKSCNCPKFGAIKKDVQMCGYANVQMKSRCADVKMKSRCADVQISNVQMRKNEEQMCGCADFKYADGKDG